MEGEEDERTCSELLRAALGVPGGDPRRELLLRRALAAPEPPPSASDGARPRRPPRPVASGQEEGQGGGMASWPGGPPFPPFSLPLLPAPGPSSSTTPPPRPRSAARPGRSPAAANPTTAIAIGRDGLGRADPDPGARGGPEGPACLPGAAD